MGHASVGIAESLGSILIGFLQFVHRQDTAHTHTAGKAADAGDALHHLAAPLHIPCPALIISLLHIRRHAAHQTIIHQRPHIAGIVFLNHAADLLIAPLEADAGSHRIRNPLLLFLIPKFQNQGKHMALAYAQKTFVIFKSRPVLGLQQSCHNKALLQHGDHNLQLFLCFQITAPLFSSAVHHAHSLSNHLHNLFLVHRLVKVFQNAEIDSFLGIVKLVVGRHHDKNKIGIVLPDLLHGLYAVDSRHLNIHKCNIRPVAFRKLNYAAPCLCGFHLTFPVKILTNDISQRVNYNSFIVSQHNFIHACPPI